jgi:CheY-like chemotaxis protein
MEKMAKKILVIDDEPLVLKTIGKMLERENFDVITCLSGQEALAVVNQQDIDLVISDIRMPHMNGVETISLIIERCQLRKKDAPPFVFITGYTDEEVNQQAQALDPTDFIYKLFNRYDFIGSINKALGIMEEF